MCSRRLDLAADVRNSIGPAHKLLLLLRLLVLGGHLAVGELIYLRPDSHQLGADVLWARGVSGGGRKCRTARCCLSCQLGKERLRFDEYQVHCGIAGAGGRKACL